MEQVIERVLCDAFLAAVHAVPVNVQRQPSDGLGQYPHAGIYSGGLHGRPLIDRLAAGRTTEQEGERTTNAVLRLIPRTEQS